MHTHTHTPTLREALCTQSVVGSPGRLQCALLHRSRFTEIIYEDLFSINPSHSTASLLLFTSHSFAHTLIHSQTHTHINSLSHTHTHSHTHTRTHTHT